MTGEDKPSSAISVRMAHVSIRKYAGQRAHDMRFGRQPRYVDGERTSLNRVIIAPPPPDGMRARTITRRDRLNPARALRSDAAVATTAIITFGRAAQDLVNALPAAEQDVAYRAVAGAISARYRIGLTGLIVHCDETGPHAHVTFDCRADSGKALSKIMHGSEVQDVVADAIARLVPGITRGVPRKERKARGEPLSKWVHRSVRQLHQDLPDEIAAGEMVLTAIREDCDIAKEDLATARGELEMVCQRLDEAEQRERELAGRLRKAAAAAEEAEAHIPAAEDALAKAGARVIEMEARVRKLENKLTEQHELTEKEAKRLETYQRRLAGRQKEVRQAEDALAGLQARMNTAEAELTGTQTDLEKLEPVLKQTRASLAEARQELKALTDRPLSDAGLLTGGLRQKNADIEARAVERAAMAGAAYERRRQALEEQFAEKIAAREQEFNEEAARREAGITQRAQDLEIREKALETAVTAIAEDRAQPAEKPGYWQVKDQPWWDSGGGGRLDPGPAGWGQSLWAGLRRYAKAFTGGIVQQLRQQVTTLTAALVTARTEKDKAERQLEATRTELASAKRERDARPTPERADELRRTSAHRLLVLGASRGSPEMIEEAIETGAKLDRTFDHDTGGTALHVAVRSGRPAAVRKLLDAGADPDVRDSKGLKPLEAARSLAKTVSTPAGRKRLEEIVKMLEPPEPEPDYMSGYSM